MLNKKRVAEISSQTQGQIISEALHCFIDDKISMNIKKSYLKHAHSIELEKSKVELMLNPHRLLSTIEILKFINELTRKASERAGIILGNCYFEFSKDFREKLGNEIDMSVKKSENEISYLVLKILKKELSYTKYKTKEQISAAGQYFKEQSSQLGIVSKEITKLIDKVLLRKISAIKHKKFNICESKLGEEGKLIIKNLRERDIINQEIVEEKLALIRIKTEENEEVIKKNLQPEREKDMVF